MDKPIDVRVAEAIGHVIRKEMLTFGGREREHVSIDNFEPVPNYSTNRAEALERWQKIGPSRRGEIVMNYGGHWTVCLSDKESRRTSVGGPSESLPATICAAILASVRDAGAGE